MTKIKICGLFQSQDTAFVNEAMPDFAGFVFYEKSRRNVTKEQADSFRKALSREIKTAGVFVNAPPEFIYDIYKNKIIDIVQLHGGESDGYISKLRGLLHGAEIWKAFLIKSKKDLEEAARSPADMVLLDNGYGTGESFDWRLIKSFGKPFILAGGLTPENIPEVLERFHPYAVDLSSGVETEGIKDRNRIAAAVAAVR